MKAKIFDAVKFMRETRDNLSKKYLKNPQAQEKDLEKIRKKFRRLKRSVVSGPSKKVHSFVK